MPEETTEKPRQSPVVNELVRRIKDFNLRIRDLEEQVQNLTNRVNTVEDTMLDKTRNLRQGQSQHREVLEDLRNEISRLTTAVDTLKGKTRKLVTRREFSEIEQYIDLMDPVRSKFTTEKEVENIAENIVTEKLKELKGDTGKQE